MGCRVEELITGVPVTLDEGASVQRVAELMAERDLGSLVVTRDGRVSGVFTERDLLRRLVGAGRDPASVTLGEVSTRNLVSVPYDCEFLMAIAKMHANRCRRLLVFGGDRLIGLGHINDLARAMADRGRRKDLLVNMVGAVTLAVSIGLIVMLVFELPDMLRLAQGSLSR